MEVVTGGEGRTRVDRGGVGRDVVCGSGGTGAEGGMWEGRAAMEGGEGRMWVVELREGGKGERGKGVGSREKRIEEDVAGTAVGTGRAGGTGRGGGRGRRRVRVSGGRQVEGGKWRGAGGGGFSAKGSQEVCHFPFPFLAAHYM